MKNATISVVTASRSLGFSLFMRGVLGNIRLNRPGSIPVAHALYECVGDILGEEFVKLLIPHADCFGTGLAYVRLNHHGISWDGIHPHRKTMHLRPSFGHVDDSLWPVSHSCLQELWVEATSSEYVYVYVTGDYGSFLFELAPKRGGL